MGYGLSSPSERVKNSDTGARHIWPKWLFSMGYDQIKSARGCKRFRHSAERINFEIQPRPRRAEPRGGREPKITLPGCECQRRGATGGARRAMAHNAASGRPRWY